MFGLPWLGNPTGRRHHSQTSKAQLRALQAARPASKNKQQQWTAYSNDIEGISLSTERYVGFCCEQLSTVALNNIKLVHLQSQHTEKALKPRSPKPSTLSPKALPSCVYWIRGSAPPPPPPFIAPAIVPPQPEACGEEACL